jgi:hypothetical protein
MIATGIANIVLENSLASPVLLGKSARRIGRLRRYRYGRDTGSYSTCDSVGFVLTKPSKRCYCVCLGQLTSLCFALIEIPIGWGRDGQK